LLFVGRADEPRKGFGVLLGAMRILEEGGQGQFALTVAGPGAEAWCEQARGMPVRFLGRLSDKELAAAYREADVCVVPSRGGESFGLVALEALAHGVPVVASRIRGYADWLADVNGGLLVEPGDETALAEALRGVAAEPGRYEEWVRRGPEVAARYSWDAVVVRVLEVYESARSKGLGVG
jgi:phosphatidylinositol alpha-mannosyltransferase